MLKIEEVKKLNDLDQLMDELKKREKLFDKLVGNLYRSIMWGEILDVRERIWKVKHGA